LLATALAIVNDSLSAQQVLPLWRDEEMGQLREAVRAALRRMGKLTG
jgi:hypothetical protein